MKKKIIMAILIIGMFSICGCGNKIPELTSEQSSLITTYATDLLMQYSPNHDTGLIDTDAEAKRREEIAEKAAKVQAIVDAQKAAEEQAKSEAEEKLQNTEVHDGEEVKTPMGTMEDMQDFLELSQLSLNYHGYQIVKSYPSEEAEEWTPTIDATSGQNLLVVSLGIQNPTDSNLLADVLSQGVQFRIMGTEAEGTAIATMLLNDFAFAREEIEAGAEKEFVLLTQIDESVTQVNDLKLYIKKSDSNLTVGLE